jgi:Tol biopolymer transport system component
MFSPDGRFVAYSSDEAGRSEVYVTPFPGLGAKWQVSPAGGQQPRWSRDGRELFYVDPANHLTVMDVVPSGAGVEFGAPRRLFQIYGSFKTVIRYDLAPDGRRLLVSRDATDDSAAPLTLITDWTRLARKD